MDVSKQLARGQDIATKVPLVFQKRAKLAQERYRERMQRAFDDNVAELIAKPPAPWEIWTNWYNYTVDSAQRSVLFWDTLRERGNNYLKHNAEGMPPVLHFKYDMVLDARKFARPVNYALVKIVPPEGVTVDPGRRPYLIIDPRAVEHDMTDLGRTRAVEIDIGMPRDVA